ncbi:hypothetical protein CHU98_g2663 [Xylaria longipes]|nr:hypothetical protein CHU98_g2663 [Xylaria longipes]
MFTSRACQVHVLLLIDEIGLGPVVGRHRQFHLVITIKSGDIYRLGDAGPPKQDPTASAGRLEYPGPVGEHPRRDLLRHSRNATK